MFSLEQHPVELNSNNIFSITMSHGRANAMDLEFCEAMVRQLEELASNPECSAVVLTGTSKIFSAGVDLKRLLSEGDAYLTQFLDSLTNLFFRTFRFPKPLIAGINGHAVAGGCILACGADYRIVVPRAKVGIPELRVGVPLPSVGIEIMRYVAAPRAFQQMVNIGATYSGERCIELGLADEISEREQMLELSLAKATELLAIPASVFEISKRQLRFHANRKIEAAKIEFEGQIQTLWHSKEIRQVIQEYVGERL